MEPTERQVEVAGLVAAGLPNEDIARTLGISENTVRHHLKQVYATLGHSSRTQLVRWFMTQGAERRTRT